MRDDKLRLLANDAEDLSILSAVAQDAIVRVADIAYLPREYRFAAVISRFRWERVKKRGLFSRSKPERVRAGLRINSVMGAKIRGIDLCQDQDSDEVLELLAIGVTPNDGDSEMPSITMTFAGTGSIRLEVECIDMVLEDISDSWSAASMPRH